MKNPPNNDWKKMLFALALAPIIIPVAIAVVMCWLVATAAIVIAVSLCWSVRGVSFLIVYSDSAQWKRYFEEEVIPEEQPKRDKRRVDD